jgi:hypothetical protein
VGPRGAPYYAPRGSPCLHLRFRVLLFNKNSMVFFPKFISDDSCMKKTERRFLLKTSSILQFFFKCWFNFEQIFEQSDSTKQVWQFVRTPNTECCRECCRRNRFLYFTRRDEKEKEPHKVIYESVDASVLDPPKLKTIYMWSIFQSYAALRSCQASDHKQFVTNIMHHRW